MYPRTIRVFADDGAVRDISADEVSPINAKWERFQPAPRADRFAACARWPATPSQEVPPSYRQAAGRHISRARSLSMPLLAEMDTLRRLEFLRAAASRLIKRP